MVTYNNTYTSKSSSSRNKIRIATIIGFEIIQGGNDLQRSVKACYWAKWWFCTTQSYL
ncbi:hypothetical protein [Helicobacter apodemus]|uniref:hypothetical protein n=1 Tax=Helicobacter apodemus TaxID=135569 RepID=UPI0018847FD8|nr:hypothetical protein [Helicobacter apodemus]